MKFIHVADLHLDRNFEGLAIKDNSLSQQLSAVNAQVLENIVTASIKEDVDCVLFAGDTFHQSRSSLKMQHCFFQQLQRLAAKKIPVFIIFGNHDYYQAEKYWFEFPENVRLFTQEEVQTKQFRTKRGEQVAISGFSYCQPWINERKALEFPSRAQADIHIGLYHGEQGKANNYAPFAIQELVEKGYDYWALGHIHVPELLHQRPHIVYAGTPQGHSQKETGTAGVLLVTIEQQQVTTVPIAVSMLQWTKAVISLEQAHTLKIAREEIGKQLPMTTEQLTLLQIELHVSAALEEELRLSVASGELQEWLYVQLQHQSTQLFLWDISMKESEKSKIPLAASRQLVDTLIKNYEHEEVLQQVLGDVFQHPHLQQFIRSDSAFAKEVIAAAETELYQRFTFSEESV